jgi:hypothetical protein
MSSRGEMKMSLSEITLTHVSNRDNGEYILKQTDIFVFQVLKKFEFTICSLGQNWGAEGFHNLLYGHILSSE